MANNNHYERLQVEVRGMLEELVRQRERTANLLNRIAEILREKVGFPDTHVWFRSPFILRPDADRFEIAKAVAMREAEPPAKLPRAYRAIERDMFVGGLKVDVGFRVEPSTGGEMEAIVPLVINVEGNTLTVVLPDKTEVQLELDDFRGLRNESENQLIAGLLDEIQKLTRSFLKPGLKERIGFRMPENKEPMAA